MTPLPERKVEELSDVIPEIHSRRGRIKNHVERVAVSGAYFPELHGNVFCRQRTADVRDPAQTRRAAVCFGNLEEDTIALHNDRSRGAPPRNSYLHGSPPPNPRTRVRDLEGRALV